MSLSLEYQFEEVGTNILLLKSIFFLEFNISNDKELDVSHLILVCLIILLLPIVVWLPYGLQQ